MKSEIWLSLYSHEFLYACICLLTSQIQAIFEFDEEILDFVVSWSICWLFSGTPSLANAYCVGGGIGFLFPA
jgi:hypothetical protein